MKNQVWIGGIVVLFEIPDDLLNDKEVLELIEGGNIPEGFGLQEVSGPFYNGIVAVTFEVDSEDYDKEVITKYVHRRVFQRKRRKSKWWQRQQ